MLPFDPQAPRVVVQVIPPAFELSLALKHAVGVAWLPQRQGLTQFPCGPVAASLEAIDDPPQVNGQLLGRKQDAMHVVGHEG